MPVLVLCKTSGPLKNKTLGGLSVEKKKKKKEIYWTNGEGKTK